MTAIAALVGSVPDGVLGGVLGDLVGGGLERGTDLRNADVYHRVDGRAQKQNPRTCRGFCKTCERAGS